MEEKVSIRLIPSLLPQPVFGAIVDDLGHNPTWARPLSYVKAKWADDLNIYLVRVFDKAIAAEAGVEIVDFKSLNRHPELVIFEGCFDEIINAAFLI